MDHRAIFREAADLLRGDGAVGLVTVVASRGSTPGKCGFKMLVARDGRTWGTVGGGLLEAKMTEQALALLDRPRTQRHTFELTGTSADEQGICGGSVSFLIETFDRTAAGLFDTLADETRGGVLLSVIRPEQAPFKVLVSDPADLSRAIGDPPAVIAEAVEQILDGSIRRTCVTTGAEDVFLEGVAAPPVLVVFGAGHVAQAIARLAAVVHFRVVVCDDRAEYANRRRFPDAEIVVADFEGIFEHVPADANSFLVIVTRGHRCDEIVLEQALRTEARYIGMIGSRRKCLTILENLRRKGLPPERLAGVHAPIGLSIGADTAEEIALSIVAELVKIRHLGASAPVDHMSLNRTGQEAGRA